MFKKIIVFLLLFTLLEGVVAQEGLFTFVVPAAPQSPFYGSGSPSPLVGELPSTTTPSTITQTPETTKLYEGTFEKLLRTFSSFFESYRSKVSEVPTEKIKPLQIVEEAPAIKDIPTVQERQKEEIAPVLEKSFFTFDEYHKAVKQSKLFDLKEYKDKIASIKTNTFMEYHEKVKEVA